MCRRSVWHRLSCFSGSRSVECISLLTIFSSIEPRHNLGRFLEMRFSPIWKITCLTGVCIERARERKPPGSVTNWLIESCGRWCWGSTRPTRDDRVSAAPLKDAALTFVMAALHQTRAGGAMSLIASCICLHSLCERPTLSHFGYADLELIRPAQKSGLSSLKWGEIGAVRYCGQQTH